MAILYTMDLRKIYGSGENEVHALDGVSISVDEGNLLLLSALPAAEWNFVKRSGKRLKSRYCF